MVRVKRNDGLPPNFDELPPEMQRTIEEDQYRRQLSWNHGFSAGRSCLTSMNAEGLPVSGQFGKRIVEKAAEKGDEHDD